MRSVDTDLYWDTMSRSVAETIWVERKGKEKMRRVYACSLFLAVLFGGTVSAALNPVGTYTLTFERDGWSVSKDLSVVFMVPGDDTVYEPFYNDPATGTPTRVYLEEVAQPEPELTVNVGSATPPMTTFRSRLSAAPTPTVPAPPVSGAVSDTT